MSDSIDEGLEWASRQMTWMIQDPLVQVEFLSDPNIPFSFALRLVLRYNDKLEYEIFIDITKDSCILNFHYFVDEKEDRTFYTSLSRTKAGIVRCRAIVPNVEKVINVHEELHRNQARNMLYVLRDAVNLIKSRTIEQ